jgi:hypothetical protein
MSGGARRAMGLCGVLLLCVALFVMHITKRYLFLLGYGVVKGSQLHQAADDHYIPTDDHFTNSTDDHGDDHHDDHHGSHSDEYGQVLLYLFCVGLAIGSIIDFVLSRFGIKVAYNLVMFSVGCFLGMLMNETYLSEFRHLCLIFTHF